MADPFVAEIRIFPFNFAPRWWALCDGQILPLAQNTALFTLLGTNYGGNGLTNFALPDLQGAAPMGWGQGQGLSYRDIGESGGSETVALAASQIPAHSHSLTASSAAGDARNPSTEASLGAAPQMYAANAQGDTELSPAALDGGGSGAPHENMQPYMTFHFCIALVGVYPPRG
ncbi:phage tail protein [Vulgatibacter incomptus]|uniref:Microcystin dependent protein n=1 Tax=Vulgatibacter incomptus TaxID=1391653 RepID=A0A0K1PEY3_9BACT|nr:tail fiber protein [Vulgatibacter incomptus]AKU91976.1 Microcystin dependent protein [Vulgatibacter incomptus]